MTLYYSVQCFSEVFPLSLFVSSASLLVSAGVSNWWPPKSGLTGNQCKRTLETRNLQEEDAMVAKHPDNMMSEQPQEQQ